VAVLTFLGTLVELEYQDRAPQAAHRLGMLLRAAAAVLQ
jgi:hypothetical protein